jgi:hypothetical protein
MSGIAEPPIGRSEQLSAVSHELGFFQNVGMSAHYCLSELPAEFKLRHVVHAALEHVIRSHAILSAIPVNEDSPDAYWARLPSIDLALCVSFVTRSRPITQSEEDSELDEILEEQHNTNFKSGYGTLPFWRLVILQDIGAKASFTASFIFHHGIGDGAAGLIFHRAFQTALNNVSLSSSPLADCIVEIKVSSEIQLLPPLEQLHPLPINGTPASFRTEGLQEWTGDEIQLPCMSRYRSLYFSSASSTRFAQRCKENGLTLTSGLHAIMAGALFDALPSTIEALTGIIPINLRPWLSLPSEDANKAIGSFIDAIKVQMRRSDYESSDQKTIRGLPAARHTSKTIKSYLADNASPSGEPYTSVAFFQAIPDVAVAFKSMVGTNRDAAFEVSNLGRFTENVQSQPGSLWRIGRMTFSRGAVVFGAAVTTSIVSGGDGALTISFSWQEGVVEDSFVEHVVGRVKEYFESDGF